MKAKTFPVASSALTPSCDISPAHGLAVFKFTDGYAGSPNAGKNIHLCWKCSGDHGLLGAHIPKVHVAHPMGVAA